MGFSFSCCCCEPEIDKFDVIVLPNHYVVWFDISMINTMLMKITNRLNDLSCDDVLLLERYIT